MAAGLLVPTAGIEETGRSLTGEFEGPLFVATRTTEEGGLPGRFLNGLSVPVGGRYTEGKPGVPEVGFVIDPFEVDNAPEVRPGNGFMIPL
jgi:hypothetical protein